MQLLVVVNLNHIKDNLRITNKEPICRFYFCQLAFLLYQDLFFYNGHGWRKLHYLKVPFLQKDYNVPVISIWLFVMSGE